MGFFIALVEYVNNNTKVLPETNTLIEYDGRQHFESVDIWGGEDALLKRKINDEIKNNYCIKNRIPLLRISYLEDVNTKLNEYFL